MQNELCAEDAVLAEIDHYLDGPRDRAHSGLFRVTPAAGLPNDPKLRALCRPTDYNQLSPAEQWEIDTCLDILDWDGT